MGALCPRLICKLGVMVWQFACLKRFVVSGRLAVNATTITSQLCPHLHFCTSRDGV